MSMHEGWIALAKTGTVQRLPLPAAAAADSGVDGAALAALYPDAVILTAGPLAGSFAPASCLMGARLPDGTTVPLAGQCGPALRRCGLDAVVLCGRNAEPVVLCLGDDPDSGIFLPLPAQQPACAAGRASMEVPDLRAFLFRHARARDMEPTLILTGPAAFAGAGNAAVGLAEGQVPGSAALAAALAAANCAGISFEGTKPLRSCLPLDNPARSAVAPAQAKDSLSAILGAALDMEGQPSGTPSIGSLPAGRSLACFNCPSPCGVWLKLPDGTHAACTDPLALVRLLCAADGDSGKLAGIPGVFRTADRFGLASESLARWLGKKLPDTLEELMAPASGCAAPVQKPGGARTKAVETGLQFGVCPFFLHRFPAVDAGMLQACLDLCRKAADAG